MEQSQSRRDTIRRLRAEGWTYEQIGRYLHVSAQKARRLEEKGPKINPSGIRPTPEQKARRQAAVARLYRQGYSFESIAAALDVSASTCQNDAQALGLGRKGRRRYAVMRADVPDKVNWLSEPQAPTTSAYRTSPVIADAQHWLEGFDGGDYPNRFAWNISEAQANGDEAWLAHARSVVERAHQQFGQLVRILNDETYRQRARSGQTEDIRTSRERSFRVVR